MTIQLETVGRRIYITGNTYPVKDRIRAAGAKWDPERKAWYVGVQRKTVAEEIAASVADVPEPDAKAPRADGVRTARYDGECPRCGRYYRQGTEIARDPKSGKWGHTTCPPAPLSDYSGSERNARLGRRANYPRSAPVEGAHEISGRRTGRTDKRYGVGGVIHAPKVAVLGGGPDGHYYTVLACRLDRPHEDNGEFDWREYAWVRAATDEEAAPLAAEVALRETREALSRDLAAAAREQGERVPGQLPEGATVLVPPRAGALIVTGERVAVADGAILYEQCGDPEMLDSIYRYVMQIPRPAPELLARVERWIARER